MTIALLVLVLIIVLADATGSGTDIAGVASAGRFAAMINTFMNILFNVAGVPAFVGAPATAQSRYLSVQ